MPILTIRLPTELHARFLEECDKRDVKPGELGRQFIEAMTDRMIDQNVGMRAAAGREPLRSMPHKSLPLGIRGFAMDGSPIESRAGSRLKTAKEKK